MYWFSDVYMPEIDALSYQKHMLSLHWYKMLTLTGISIQNARSILMTYDHCEETLVSVDKSLKLYERINTNENVLVEGLIEQLGEGWIAEEALSISILASLVFRNDFRKGVLYAVNHSGDSDSTGSNTGNILGLINGIEAIPEKWESNLRHIDIVKQVAEDLYIQSKGDHFDPDDEWWEKYPGY